MSVRETQALRRSTATFFSFSLSMVTLDVQIARGRKGDIDCTVCKEFDRVNEAEWEEYEALVESYAARDIRYESDRIPAFSGTSGLLERQFRTLLLFGLPENFPDFALLWRPVGNRAKACRTSGFVSIPSWSWGSHEISVVYHSGLWMSSEVDWYCLDEESGLRAVRSLKIKGTSAPIRSDFKQPVVADQLAAVGINIRVERPMAALNG